MCLLRRTTGPAPAPSGCTGRGWERSQRANLLDCRWAVPRPHARANLAEARKRLGSSWVTAHSWRRTIATVLDSSGASAQMILPISGAFPRVDVVGLPPGAQVRRSTRAGGLSIRCGSIEPASCADDRQARAFGRHCHSAVRVSARPRMRPRWRCFRSPGDSKAARPAGHCPPGRWLWPAGCAFPRRRPAR